MAEPLRVTVIGCGLVGGSVGLALSASEDVVVAAGYDADASGLETAVAVGAVGRAAGSIEDAVADVDVVVVAVPVSSIPEIALAAAGHLRSGAVITDVGSVKAPIVRAVQAHLPDGVEFVGGHPMAGSEQHGIAAASADLFRHASWPLTPTDRTQPEALSVVSRLVRATGASPILLDPQVHDEVVATVSHLPQVIASALMNVAARHGEDAPPVLRLAAGGFRDVTRIAAGNPAVWEDILTANAAAVGGILDEFIDEIAAFRDSLSDRTAMHALLEHAHDARRTLPGLAVADDIWSVVVAVSDRPGEFAELTTAVGEAGVNIVDLELRHSPEGGRGLLYLAVAGAEAAQQAVDVLRGLDHAVHRERAVR